MPSSTAALVADTASSIRCLRSFSSISVCAPTWTTATPPEILASRSLSLSRSHWESVHLDLAAQLRDASSDSVFGAAAVDDRGRVLGDHHAPCRSQHLEADLSELQPDVGGDHLAAGRDGHVFEHRLATVAEPWRLDRSDCQASADLVDDQRRQRLAIDVLGHDHQRTAGRTRTFSSSGSRSAIDEILPWCSSR